MVSEQLDLPGRRRLFQFTLGDLFVAMFGICVGASIRVPNVPLTALMLAAVMFWFVLGVGNQIRDLWGAFHGRPELSHNQQWGWRLAVFWRIGVVCLLIGCYLVAQLLNHRLLHLPEGEVNSLVFGATLRVSVFYLTLVIIMSSSPKPRAHWRQTWWATAMEIVGLLAGMLLTFLVAANGMCTAAMVEFSIRGILAAQPVQFFDADTAAYLADRSSFFWFSLCATASIPAAFVLLRRLAQSWDCSRRQRWLWGGLALLAVSLSGLYPVWLATTGFGRVSPYLERAMQLGPLHRWISAAILLVIAVTALTYRIASSPLRPSVSEISWRKHAHTYYYERAPVLAILAIAALLNLAGEVRLVRSCSLPWYELCNQPLVFLVAAVILLAMRGILVSFRRSAPSAPGEILELPLGLFCTVWTATFLLILTGLTTLAGFGFAVWLSPWYLDCWP
jgi:hypothetical protein